MMNMDKKFQDALQQGSPETGTPFDEIHLLGENATLLLQKLMQPVQKLSSISMHG